MIASPGNRYRLDDLRRLATALGSDLGMTPPRASALASHLLWFDAAGAHSHGIATLPGWLGRIESGEIDPTTPGRAILEKAGTAVFDAQRGLPPLALEAAAGIAAEKARDVGVGIVRIRNIGPTGPSAPVAFQLAIGPFAAMIAGPSASLALAAPTAEGLPAVYDSELARSTEGPASLPDGWPAAFGPWIATCADEAGWVILALSIPSMESLSRFHERSAILSGPAVVGTGSLSAGFLEARRREAREHGLALDPIAEAALKEWAGRAKTPWVPAIKS